MFPPWTHHVPTVEGPPEALFWSVMANAWCLILNTPGFVVHGSCEWEDPGPGSGRGTPALRYWPWAPEPWAIAPQNMKDEPRALSRETLTKSRIRVLIDRLRETATKDFSKPRTSMKGYEKQSKRTHQSGTRNRWNYPERRHGRDHALCTNGALLMQNLFYFSQSRIRDQ